MKELNKDLVEYIENNIFPLYIRNDEGHNINHIKTVIERSLKFAEAYDTDVNMNYTIAAYHDLGIYIDRKRHEIISAEMFMEDEEIKKFFNDEQLIIIKEAIEDHRASSDHEPRSIYGKIVSTADRTIIDIDHTIRRSLSYGKRNHGNISDDELIEKTYSHLKEKYGKGGYVKTYLEDKEFDEALDKLQEAIADKESFINRIKSILPTIK